MCFAILQSYYENMIDARTILCLDTLLNLESSSFQGLEFQSCEYWLCNTHNCNLSPTTAQTKRGGFSIYGVVPFSQKKSTISKEFFLVLCKYRSYYNLLFQHKIAFYVLFVLVRLRLTYPSALCRVLK